MNYPLLLKCTIDTPNTVVDENWEWSIDKNMLSELLELTGLKSYKYVLEVYEGFTVEQILSENLNF